MIIWIKFVLFKQIQIKSNTQEEYFKINHHHGNDFGLENPRLLKLPSPNYR